MCIFPLRSIYKPNVKSMNKSETCHESFFISLKFIEAKNNKITQNRNSNP